MADISKCLGKDCPLKDKCYRYTAPNSDRQSWMAPEKTEDGICEDFIDNLEAEDDI